MSLRKLAVFDFDGTLAIGETVKHLADQYNCSDEIHAANQAAITGKQDIFNSLQTYGKHLAGMDYSDVLRVCQNMKYAPGAKETIHQLKELNYKVICFSGGFSIAREKQEDEAAGCDCYEPE